MPINNIFSWIHTQTHWFDPFGRTFWTHFTHLDAHFGRTLADANYPLTWTQDARTHGRKLHKPGALEEFLKKNRQFFKSLLPKNVFNYFGLIQCVFGRLCVDELFRWAALSYLRGLIVWHKPYVIIAYIFICMDNSTLLFNFPRPH